MSEYSKHDWVTLSCLTALKPSVCSVVPKSGLSHALRSFDGKKINKAREDAGHEMSVKGVSIVTFEDDDYPPSLRTIECPPACLYVKGNISSLTSCEYASVSIVGTRTATPQGMHIARSFARDIAMSHVVVVSGMANGIDSSSHEGALDADGITVAVIGTGLGKLSRKRSLVDRISPKGAVISEFPNMFPGGKWTFSWRNRIIASISQATLVVEAPKKSGALITARNAMEMGKDVMACPGLPGMKSFAGCNQLIKDSAHLADNSCDVLDILGVEPLTGDDVELSESEQEVVNVCQRPMTIDEICEKLNKPPEMVLSVLTVLDLRNIIKKLPGGTYMRSSMND